MLDSGDSPLQPMITFWGVDSFETQHRRADLLAHEIVGLGGMVVRIKVEADLTNDEVPQSLSEAVARPTGYFEHHIKVLLLDSTDLLALRGCALACHARLSRNARRERPDGRTERFIT